MLILITWAGMIFFSISEKVAEVHMPKIIKTIPGEWQAMQIKFP